MKYILLLAGVLGLIACKQKVSYKKTPGGLTYKLYEGTGKDTAQMGNFLKLHTKTILNISGKDSLVYDSYDVIPAYVQVSGYSRPYDISELFSTLKVGDSIVATQLIDSFIVKNPMLLNQGFKNGDQVITHISVLGIFANDSLRIADEEKEVLAYKEKEVKVIEKYLADKKITAQKTPEGTFVEIIKEGEGALIDSGHHVSVNYTGTSFSGTKFDSNTDSAFNHVDPLKFTVNVSSMIQGFHAGMKALKKGSVARLYIPSLQAYGGNPMSPNIKPYEHLIFDIEVLDVSEKAPAAPQMPPRGN